MASSASVAKKRKAGDGAAKNGSNRSASIPVASTNGNGLTRRKPKKKGLDHLPPPDATFVLESKFLREMFAFLLNFQEHVNLVISQEGIEMCFMDSSHISVIRATIRSQGCISAWWNHERGQTNFVVGVAVKEWKCYLHNVSGSSPYVKLSLAAEADKTLMEFGYLVGDDLDTVHTAILHNIVIRTDAFHPPQHTPWLSVSFDSKVMRKEIAMRAKLKPDNIVFRINGEMRELELESSIPPPLSAPPKSDPLADMSYEQLLADFLEEAPAVAPSEPKMEGSPSLPEHGAESSETRTAYVPEEFLVVSTGSGGDFMTHFELVESKDARDMPIRESLPGWKRGIRIASNRDDEDEDAAADPDSEKKPERKAVVKGLDDNDNDDGGGGGEVKGAGVSGKGRVSALNQRSILFCGVVTKIGPRPAVKESTGAMKNEFLYSPGILNNVTAGAAFSPRVLMEIYPEEVLRIAYDMDSLGVIECYIAARIEQD